MLYVLGTSHELWPSAAALFLLLTVPSVVSITGINHDICFLMFARRISRLSSRHGVHAGSEGTGQVKPATIPSVSASLHSYVWQHLQFTGLCQTSNDEPVG